MKKRLLGLALLAVSASASAQTIKRIEPQPSPEYLSWQTPYTVDGYRHGISFFKKVRSEQVEYEPSGQLSFDKYHAALVVYYWMERFAKEHPDLVQMYEVGFSYEGRPIYQVTLTNSRTGKATDKPAVYFEGNRHSGEVTSAESVLWLMNYLVTEYGKNDEVTAILDKNAVHLRPINNPDGHNLYMYTAQSNRSSVRPMDEDGDGLLDEDSPEDINNDGVVTRMRYKDPTNGCYNLDSRDTTGRAMVDVGKGKGEYTVVSEGIDNDGDGKINEDAIGGLDLHRNYPENWRPSVDSTGRGYTQFGPGEFPLSEPETRAVVSFLLTNPNIYIVNSMDTRVPMHLRAPSTSASNERMYPEDLKHYEAFDALGKSITGYERAGDAYEGFGSPNPIFGHGPDFGYWYYGSVWYGDEIWDGGKCDKDYNGDGVIDELDKLIKDDSLNNGCGFKRWQKINHPSLGEVEVGGWDPKFYMQNAPSTELEPWARKQALFNIAMTKCLPSLEWSDIVVKSVKRYKSDSTDYRIDLSYRNNGKLPSAFRQADLVKIVKPDRAVVSFDKSLTEGDAPRIKIITEGELEERWWEAPQNASNKVLVPAGYVQGESMNTVSVVVRVYGSPTGIEGAAELLTTRAGILPSKKFHFCPVKVQRTGFTD